MSLNYLQKKSCLQNPNNITKMKSKFLQDNNPCLSNPCQNGGTCKPNVLLRTYTCTCGIYFAGENCGTGKSASFF